MAWDRVERRKQSMHCQGEIITLLSDMETAHVKMYEENKKSIDKIVGFIEGNGNPGVKVRIDRLELKSSMLSFVTAGVVMSLIGYSMKLIFKM